MKRENKISTKGKFEIEFIALKEPNNGRMLWEVNLFHNGLNVNHLIFEDDWNCLNYELKHWQLENSQYYYIPKESKALLLNKMNLEITELKYQTTSTARFKGNIFHENKLVELFDESIEITNLESEMYQTIDWKLNGILKSVEIDNTGNLNIYYEDYDIHELSILASEAVKIIEYQFLEIQNEDLIKLKAELKSIMALKQRIGLSEQSINYLYGWFLPTSIWDDFTGHIGETIGNKMLAKVEKLKFGKMETVTIK